MHFYALLLNFQTNMTYVGYILTSMSDSGWTDASIPSKFDVERKRLILQVKYLMSRHKYLTTNDKLLKCQASIFDIYKKICYQK